jgi:predicted nucleic acid-binding protein
VIVLDASAALELILRTPAGEIVAARIAPPGESLHAPHLIDLEVAQVLRRYESSRTLSPERAREALEDFMDLEVTRYSHEALLPRIWELRKNTTAYDGAYLALAEALGAGLLTADVRMASMPGHEARVEVVAGRI